MYIGTFVATVCLLRNGALDILNSLLPRSIPVRRKLKESQQ